MRFGDGLAISGSFTSGLGSARVFDVTETVAPGFTDDSTLEVFAPLGLGWAAGFAAGAGLTVLRAVAGLRAAALLLVVFVGIRLKFSWLAD
jgi:hypothetical protein